MLTSNPKAYDLTYTCMAMSWIVLPLTFLLKTNYKPLKQWHIMSSIRNKWNLGPVASQVFWVKICWSGECKIACMPHELCQSALPSSHQLSSLQLSSHSGKACGQQGCFCEIPALEHIKTVRDSDQVWGHREISEHFSERMQVASGPQHGLLNLFLNPHNWGSVTQAGWHYVPCVWVYFLKYFLNSLWRAKSQALRTDLWGLLKPLQPLAVW